MSNRSINFHNQSNISKNLENVLASFGIKGTVTGATSGPVLTVYEFEPIPGTRLSKISSLAEDIALNMAVSSVRVSPIVNNGTIGIEIPNTLHEVVSFDKIVNGDTFKNSNAVLPIVLGKDIVGKDLVADLAKMPHLLVAGTTGSGKSVWLHTMILSLMSKLSADQCKFVLIDPKMLELSVYNGLPNLIAPVVTDKDKVIETLEWLNEEMEERYSVMANTGVRNIETYNSRSKSNNMPYIVVVIEEIADLVLELGDDLEAHIQSLAQKSRAAGIHLILATQRPSVDVITGTIKSNFPTRISFKMASKIDSRTIINEQGAETLLGNGDMLYLASGKTPVRIQGAFVSDNEIEKLIVSKKIKTMAINTERNPEVIVHQKARREVKRGSFMSRVVGYIAKIKA